VLGVLVQILRGNAIAADCGLAREGDIAFKHLTGAAADSYIGAVAVEALSVPRCSLLRRRDGSVPVVAPARRALI
jgi:hypothetical protein